MTQLWQDPRWYGLDMEPDEEAEWAEHDRRCGHTPFCELGNDIFSPISATERISPSASGLLLSPPRSPDAVPLKEAA